ncbi:8554_t:CDS:2 [Funneliformis geosporum]|uniref:17243_t:CDS:1 n=1 Tax=Funneliformis geosporum TaxID=1117311 RepID=A0A9W4SC87_9GLOM|nr:8554_t:CDS:2 [Funneliformis geosporum]CAI2164006.1 17243_t:CDS:2 [Funneliformis geosporum]
MPSIKLIVLTILVVFNFCAVSEITILTPNPKFYGVVNEPLLITWTSSGNDDPQSITIKLISKTPTELFAGEYAVGQSIPTADGKYAWNITDNLVGENNWILKFYNAMSELNDKTAPVAQSKEFSIKPVGTEPPKNDSSTTETKKNNSNPVTSLSYPSLFIIFVSFISSVIMANSLDLVS